MIACGELFSCWGGRMSTAFEEKFELGNDFAAYKVKSRCRNFATGFSPSVVSLTNSTSKRRSSQCL